MDTSYDFGFTKKDDTNLDVHTFYHWSTDTEQDAWFTASSFNAVFETLDPKPQWVKILSDNGGHYHNFELMTIITNWHQWYNIEIAHAIKRYICIGHCLDEGENIQTAIAGLGGTSVANLEPVRNNATVKTIAGITKLSYFKWPITGDYAVKAPLHKPIPNVTSHTIPSTTWNFPISRAQCKTNNKLIHGNKFITT
uniref:Uncharacterized protein n=1 Tax=Rhizophagus irregularis (strain DAOM 181602 / DAOM 197198 / MUCL 43194) TaxID=747089 RepID=U9UGL7_RHIID